MTCKEAKKVTFHCRPSLMAQLEQVRTDLERTTRIPNVTLTAAIVVALERGIEAMDESFEGP